MNKTKATTDRQKIHKHVEWLMGTIEFVHETPIKSAQASKVRDLTLRQFELKLMEELKRVAPVINELNASERTKDCIFRLCAILFLQGWNEGYEYGGKRIMLGLPS